MKIVILEYTSNNTIHYNIYGNNSRMYSVLAKKADISASKESLWFLEAEDERSSNNILTEESWDGPPVNNKTRYYALTTKLFP